jgi:hypothetical protein
MKTVLLDVVLIASFIESPSLTKSNNSNEEIKYSPGLLYEKQFSTFKPSKNIANFCFPEKFNNHLETADVYDDSFVFCSTDNSSIRYHCFCLRFQPLNDRPPECICVITKYFWKKIMHTILTTLHSFYYNSPLYVSSEQPSQDDIDCLLLPVLDSINQIGDEFPAQGESFDLVIPKQDYYYNDSYYEDYEGKEEYIEYVQPEYVQPNNKVKQQNPENIEKETEINEVEQSVERDENDSDDSYDTISLQRPYDLICSSHISLQHNLMNLFEHLSPCDVVSLHQWLLLERSTIVVGSSLTNVSNFCYSLLSIFIPFTFTGVFIPILPYALSDFLSMPYHFLVGVQTEV